MVLMTSRRFEQAAINEVAQERGESLVEFGQPVAVVGHESSSMTR
jgi:hypothetical protein